MKKLLLTISVLLFMNSMSETDFAQEKTKEKVTPIKPPTTPKKGASNGTGSGRGTGSGIGSGIGSGANEEKVLSEKPPSVAKPRSNNKITQSLKIISKPKPAYTDAARENNVTGTVALKVTFLASGKIGKVTPVRSLPDGLTERAVEAAKQIRFEPQLKKGIPITVTKLIEYNFHLY